MANFGEVTSGNIFNLCYLLERDSSTGKTYLKVFSHDPELWDIVKDGYETPKDVIGTKILGNDFDANQKKKYKMHLKAKTFMMNIITFNEFEICSKKETTNSIYDALVLN